MKESISYWSFLLIGQNPSVELLKLDKERKLHEYLHELKPYIEGLRIGISYPQELRESFNNLEELTKIPEGNDRNNYIREIFFNNSEESTEKHEDKNISKFIFHTFQSFITAFKRCCKSFLNWLYRHHFDELLHILDDLSMYLDETRGTQLYSQITRLTAELIDVRISINNQLIDKNEETKMKNKIHKFAEETSNSYLYYIDKPNMSLADKFDDYFQDNNFEGCRECAEIKIKEMNPIDIGKQKQSLKQITRRYRSLLKNSYDGIRGAEKEEMNRIFTELYDLFYYINKQTTTHTETIPEITRSSHRR